MAYDKQKAHEYYVNYVKKGLKKGRSKKSAEEQAASSRKSTKGLNDAGKDAAKQIKEQIKEQRKLVYDRLKEEMNAKIAELKERIKQSKAIQKKKDYDLLEDHPEDIDALKAEIEEVRAMIKKKKETVKNYFDEKYYQMLDELKADSDYKSVGKKRKKK